MTTTAVKKARADDGAAAVEFALVSLVLFPLLFGILFFGIVLAQQLALSNSVRQAARFTVTDGRTCADAMQQALNSSGTVGLNTSEVIVKVSTVTPAGVKTTKCGPTQPGQNLDGSGVYNGSDAGTLPCVGTAIGDSVVVESTYVSPLIFPIVVPNNLTLQNTGTYRCEYR